MRAPYPPFNVFGQTSTCMHIACHCHDIHAVVAELTVKGVAAQDKPQGDETKRQIDVANETTKSAGCSDDDACLHEKWGSAYTCADSIRYCESYVEDMRCCPKSCQKCPPEGARVQWGGL